MKRIYIFILFIFSFISINADETFNPKVNYQGNNGMAYLGEILDVNYMKSVPEDWSKWDNIDHPEIPVAYDGFMDYDKFDPMNTSWNAVYYFYHHENENTFLFSYAGTRRDYLVGKSFRVVNVYHRKIYKYHWIFELENINNPSDKCYYIYYGGYEFDKSSSEYLYSNFNNFPLTARKYKEYKAAKK